MRQKKDLGKGLSSGHPTWRAVPTLLEPHRQPRPGAADPAPSQRSLQRRPIRTHSVGKTSPNSRPRSLSLLPRCLPARAGSLRAPQSSLPAGPRIPSSSSVHPCLLLDHRPLCSSPDSSPNSQRPNSQRQKLDSKSSDGAKAPPSSLQHAPAPWIREGGRQLGRKKVKPPAAQKEENSVTGLKTHHARSSTPSSLGRVGRKAVQKRRDKIKNKKNKNIKKCRKSGEASRGDSGRIAIRPPSAPSCKKKKKVDDLII